MSVSRAAAFASVGLLFAFACGGNTAEPPSGAAGSGASGAGGAQGGAGASQGGGGSAQAGTTSWNACSGPGTCVLDAKGCCGACDPTTADVDGVARGHEQEHRNAVCGMDVACGPCPPGSSMGASLFAACDAGSCTPVDVRTDAVSACTKDEDCVFRGPGCCDPCGIQPEQIIALSQTGLSTYLAEVCPATGPMGCPDCAPIYPPGTHAICGADHHCRAVVPAACPQIPPSDGSSCNLADGTVCEWGDDVRIACRTRATCNGGHFALSVPSCPPAPGPGQQGCPASTAAQGQTCSPDGLLCDMSLGTTCLCSQCPGGPCTTESHWACTTPPAGCPMTAPNVGQACGVDGTSCSYGTCGGPAGALRKCVNGVWVDVPQACPV